MDWVKTVFELVIESIIIGGILGIATLASYDLELNKYGRDKKIAEKKALIAPIVIVLLFKFITNGIM